MGELRAEVEGQEEREKQAEEALAKGKAYIRGLECLIAQERLQIYNYEDMISTQ